MLNVASIIHFPVFGGPGNRNSLIAPWLSDRGYQLHVVIPDSPGNAQSRFAERGVSVTQMPLHRVRRSANPMTHLKYVTHLRREIAQLRRFIRDHAIDVVLVNGSHNPHGAFAARAEGRGVVWQILDTFPNAAFLHAAMPLVTRLSDVIMTNGMATAAMHPGALEFEGPLINFGPSLRLDRFTPRTEIAAAARRELGLSPTDVVVGTVNNINPMKGHFTFLRAAAMLKRTHATKHVILGAEHHDAYTQSVLAEAERLDFRLGSDLIIRDAGPRVHELAQAFDLFWLTSEPRAEGMSNSLAEAQALGIPVIATRSGAVHECMRDGETGFLVPPHDVAGIVEHSVRIISDEPLRRRLSGAAREHAHKSFQIETVAERHATAFDLALQIRAQTKCQGGDGAKGPKR